MLRRILLAIAITAATGTTVHAWEGDDGGLDQWEVSVGRWAERGEQMQLTTPPAPPSTSPPVPVFSSSSSNGRCVGAIPLLQFYSPGWDVQRMAGIMYRESRCQPGAHNSCCHGLLQIHESWCGYLGRNLGPCNLYDPVYNIQAARLVWLEQGYPAWSTS